MAKRMILMLIAIGVILSVLGAVKYKQVQTAIAQSSSFQPPPEAVTTVVAAEERWPASLSAIGTATAVRGVTVSADLPGIIERIAFDSGRAVRQGELLVRLDTRQEQAQLAAVEAQWELNRLNLDRMRGLREKGVVSQAEFDRAAAEFKQAEAGAGEIRAAIDRKTIRAPFSGMLGIRQVNLGQYLKAGDPVVPLQALDPIYVDFDVPQQDAGKVGPGTEVRVTIEGAAGAAVPGAMTGKVTALDSVVDPGTRNVQVQATLANPDGELRPGMFVSVSAILGAGEPVVSLPASAISYAPYGDSVFVVGDLQAPDGQSYRGVRQQFVKLGGARGDQVAVVGGIEPGAEVVTSGVFKLRNGAAVLINNEVQPANDPAPRPANE